MKNKFGYVSKMKINKNNTPTVQIRNIGKKVTGNNNLVI